MQKIDSKAIKTKFQRTRINSWYFLHLLSHQLKLLAKHQSRTLRGLVRLSLIGYVLCTALSLLSVWSSIVIVLLSFGLISESYYKKVFQCLSFLSNLVFISSLYMKNLFYPFVFGIDLWTIDSSESLISYSGDFYLVYTYLRYSWPE